MEKNLESYTTLSKKEIEELNIFVKKRNKEIKKLQKMLEGYFKFDIVDYIVTDIIDNEEFIHICSMIGLAKANNRITEENSQILVEGIKRIFRIKCNYDKLNKKILLGNSVEEWKERYYKFNYINVQKYFNDMDINILKKLNVDLKDKKYTEYEFDILQQKVFKYYKDEEMTKEEMKFIPNLPIDITDYEYKNILSIINKIYEDYYI